MKICIQTGDIIDRVGTKKGYSLIADAGFEAVDWNLDHAWKGIDIHSGDYRGKCIFERELDDVAKFYRDELESIKSNGLVVSQAHAPFPAYIDNDPDFLDYSIEIYKRNIEYCSLVECKNLVVHGISPKPNSKYGISNKLNGKLSPNQTSELNRKLYTSLIPTLLENNVTVCLENLFTVQRGACCQGHCSYPEDAKREIDELNELAGKEVFGFCFDTGHANLLRQDIRNFIVTLGKRIKCVHTHDNNGESDNHLSPFTGTIDWNDFCSAFKEIGYDGDISFETFNQTNKVLNFGEELLPAWLKLIYETGVCFKNRIEKK